MNERMRPRVLAIIGPGILVAATGVGAGDLATAGFTGSQLGTAALWAVVVGAFLKFVLNEGLARWQLATGKTLLEGIIEKFGLAAVVVFLPYLLVWSFFVGSALMSACGVTMHAALPIFESASTAKIVFGILHSLLGVTLILAGGFLLFERVMGICIGAMFVTVVVTAVIFWPGTEEVLHGIFVPAADTLQGEGLTWTVALMGGVGGTLTVLCYGYWIREKGRSGAEAVRTCRIDLGVAYGMTAIFGIAMVIIGGRVNVEGRGASLIVDLARALETPLGPLGKWAFVVGAWGAVFSSLLGVWQSVPYIFADLCGQIQQRWWRDSPDGPSPRVDTDSLAYRSYLIFIAIVPMLGLWVSFKEIQKIYAVIGACFMPLLALSLLILNGRRAWVGARFRNRWPTAVVLVATLAFFGVILWWKVEPLLG